MLRSYIVCLMSWALLHTAPVYAYRDFSSSGIMKIVMLGTGNPMPDPNRRGPSTAIIVNNQPYIFDAGEGIWRATGEADPMAGGPIVALGPKNLTKVFLTHLHSDHITGLPAPILHPWQFGRQDPVSIYGPPGTERMVEYLLEAYREDIYQRMYSISQNSYFGIQARGFDFEKAGKIYTDENVTIETILTRHAAWPITFGYRITTPDRVIVISGGTTPTQSIIEASRGTDVLIHEVIGIDDRDKAPWGKSTKSNKPIKVGDVSRFFHTTTKELADIAKQSQPKLLILYHEQNWSQPYEPDALVEEIKRFGYGGKVYSSQDMDIY